MYFKMDLFTGCRFGLFYYSTKQTGGFVDFSKFQFLNRKEEGREGDGLLNNNWKFTYGDQVTATSKEIASWQDIGIPHSFGIPYFMEKEFYVGYGTYSTWISLAEEDCKRLRLEF